MSGIRFENQSRWMVRNWTFEHFMNEVIKDQLGDPLVAETCQLAVYHNGLHLDLIKAHKGERLAKRVFAALEKTTARLLSENEAAFPAMKEDREGRRLALGDVARLSELLERVRESKHSEGENEYAG